MNIDVTLPCGCVVDVDVPVGVEIGVELVACPAGCVIEFDAGPAGPFLVTWRQVIAVTAVPLEVPDITAVGELLTARPPATADVDELPAPAAPSVDRPFTERPLEPGDVLSSPRTAEEWKHEADLRGITTAALLQRTREIADANNLPTPRALGLEEVDEVLTPLVIEWLDHHHPAKGDR